MSASGKRAAAAVAKIALEHGSISARRAAASLEAGEDDCVNEPDCEGEEEGDAEEAPGGQAELSIAVDESGQHIVIGFNDTRGFSENPISVSGFLYSDDGGETFVDGGQLPSPGNEVIGTTLLPQVFGDPEVKYLGNCVFVYSSIVSRRSTATAAVQTMGVHRSTDCGKTWQGPFEVTAATNPNGIVDANDAPLDAADKEFMDVDPDTGRVIMSWSNFTPVAPGGVEIRTTFSRQPEERCAADLVDGCDRRGDGSGRASVDSAICGIAGTNAYVAWRRFPFPGTFFGFGNTRRVRALARQWRDLAGADRDQRRVLHDGSGARQRSRQHFAVAGRRQLARAAPRHDLSRLRQQQQRRRRRHRVPEKHERRRLTFSAPARAERRARRRIARSGSRG